MSDLFVLDLWRPVHRAPGRFIRAAMRWHFGSVIGSASWLKRAPALPFDPLTDVKGVEDLRLVPDHVDELRQVPVGDLAPRRLRGHRIAGGCDSGGTTGAPERLPAYGEWLEHVVSWIAGALERGGVLVEQAAGILRTQQVEVLVATPPLLERMVCDDALLELLQRQVKGVVWGGAHLDADSRELLRNDILAGTR
ncbi:hypothetical protein C3492_36870 [Streptomyces sp. Ru62]|uniref:hypothetical protein n=1 Tax=Streptomyces sp. Ru62 TaxID=2080745 RepID=UPI000CDD0AAE|nr:hypothetical protein [Streptomyces sp. Ru62]POX58621.1 hypothetical protein C3492_36870 [Streptomyces sp. Ru62]